MRGYLSLGDVRRPLPGPFVGGLFLDAGALDTLSGGSFVIDHDEDLQEQLGVFWDVPWTAFWLGVTQRYHSGLVTNAGAPQTSWSARTRPTQLPHPFQRESAAHPAAQPLECLAGARLQQYGLPFEVQLDVLHLTGERSVQFPVSFWRTHVIPPRTVAGSIRYVF